MDPYIHSRSHLLKNKANLHTPEALAAHEARMVFKGSLQKREKIVRQEKINAENKMVTYCQLTNGNFCALGYLSG